MTPFNSTKGNTVFGLSRLLNIISISLNDLKNEILFTLGTPFSRLGTDFVRLVKSFFFNFLVAKGVTVTLNLSKSVSSDVTFFRN